MKWLNMKWLNVLSRRKRPSRAHKPVETVWPPNDWSDIEGWNRHLESQKDDRLFVVPANWREYLALGKRIWFPGCGIGGDPRLYSLVGYKVLATDFSPVAVQAQRSYASIKPEDMFEYWAEFSSANGPFDDSGQFEVVEHDFVEDTPPGTFDVIDNDRAFQGLSPSAMAAAARTFFGALRPGGLAVFHTANVGDGRDVLEGSLAEAGFCVHSISSPPASPLPSDKVAEVIYGSG